MDQVLGIDVAARERAGVAAESGKMAEHVEGGQGLKRHDRYTELEAELIRQGFKARAHDITVQLLAALPTRFYLEVHGFGLERFLTSITPLRLRKRRSSG